MKKKTNKTKHQNIPISFKILGLDFVNYMYIIQYIFTRSKQRNVGYLFVQNERKLRSKHIAKD